MVMGATARLPPSRCSSRDRISAAAWLVKVTAVISPGRTPCSSTSQAIRATRVFVLPVPGPAVTTVTGAMEAAASICRGFRPSGWKAAGAASGAGADFFSSRRGLGFPAGRSRPNRESCPLNRAISPGVSREMTPYSPSKPGLRSTCPARRRRMPSATQGPAARAMSSTGTSRRMEHSGPSFRSSCSYRAWVAFPAAEAPVEAAMTSGRGARLSKGLAVSGRNPAGRSARASTRCSTPMVSFFPHTGQMPPRAAVSAGVRQTPQFRWPSR